MDWLELELDPRNEETLRGRWEIKDPAQVVQLAWGSPSLLERVIPAEEVERIRRSFPPSGGAPFDSSKFALGARLGPAPTLPDPHPDFEARRDELLRRLGSAADPGLRTALETQLVELYRGVGR